MESGETVESSTRIGYYSGAPPSDDELELERDMEYFVEPEEALGPRTGDLGE
jgi:hypothetical protein